MIIKVDDPRLFKQKALQWACSFDVACYLDSNNFSDPYTKFDALIAIGARHELTAQAGTAFNELEQFRAVHSGWLPGFFGYDLKNETERLTSTHEDKLNFPDMYFFVPEYIIVIRGQEAEVIADDAQFVLACIDQQQLHAQLNEPAVNLKPRISKATYLSAAAKIKEHISRGDIYVTNYCQEFFAENAAIDPLDTFFKLNSISPNPFAAFFKWNNKYVLCASPERFLAKRGSKLISQPIKGTARRGKNNTEEDELIKQELRNHSKELQENVMIVDLVRNDLTRSAKKGTVKTEELFGVYTFEHLHQMISTVVCELSDDVSPVTAIKNSFPMGSMTGAPKISAMELMDHYEGSRRGVYSGAVGYFSPDNDFDFNVVIRSLLYNHDKKLLSFQVGSAITYHADAEKEYDECLLKAQAILEALGQKSE